jgi:hypothetical protein
MSVRRRVDSCKHPLAEPQALWLVALQWDRVEALQAGSNVARVVGV